MKKIGIALLLSTFSLNLFCQGDSVIVLDSTYIDQWDTITKDWVLDGHMVYIFDVLGNQTERTKYDWDSEANEWVYSSKELSYWSELTTSIPNNITDLDCFVYPNPTNDKITIETVKQEQFSIVINSLNGQFIYGTEMYGTAHQIDLSSFRKGIYLITIRSKDFVTTEKIIKL